MIGRPRRSPLFPSTTLFRSVVRVEDVAKVRISQIRPGERGVCFGLRISLVRGRVYADGVSVVVNGVAVLVNLRPHEIAEKVAAHDVDAPGIAALPPIERSFWRSVKSDQPITDA